VLPLSLLFGIVVGLSLGLTGGGGAIFAVPLLVYGLGVPAKDAVVISLVSVGTTALIGCIHRWRLGEVEFKTGLMFALAGMVGAPIGTWISTFIPETLLMILFSVLMLTVAARMWQQSNRTTKPALVTLKTDTNNERCVSNQNSEEQTCQRDQEERLLLTTRCALLLLGVGVFIGIQTGLFGVGGGFVIVPALVLFSQMSIHRAVGTSLMVIALISATGVFSQLLNGRQLPVNITSLFIVGGVIGMFIGQYAARKISPKKLQKVFSIAILLVALFVLIRNFLT